MTKTVEEIDQFIQSTTVFKRASAYYSERRVLAPIEQRCEHCSMIVYNQHMLHNLITGSQKCSICCKKFKQ